MKLSVIVPVYNTSKFLRDTVESLIRQDFQDMEILCVDDCSTDGSLEILQDACKRDTRFQLLRQDVNKGVAAARKRAGLISKGEYVLFVDGDDALEEGACSTLVAEMDRQKVDILHFGIHIRRQGNLSEAEEYNFLTNAKPYSDRIESSQLYNACFFENKFYFTLWNKIYNGEIIRKVFRLFPDDRMDIAEDLLTAFMIQYFSRSYAPFDKPFYIYNFGEGITGGKQITLKHMRQFAQQGVVLKALDAFIQSQNATLECEKARNRIHDTFVEAAIWNWAKEIPEYLAAEGFDIISKTFDCKDLLLCCMQHFEDWHLNVHDLLKRVNSSKTLRYNGRPVKTVASYYMKAYNGGIERVMCALSNIWLKMGYRVILITDEPENENDYSYDRARITRVVINEAGNATLQEKSEKLFDAIKTYNIDAVVFHNWCSPQLFHSLFTVKAAGAAAIVHTHSLFCHSFQTACMTFSIIGAELGMLFQFAESVVALTDVDAQWWKLWNSNTFKTVNPFHETITPRLPSPAQGKNILLIGRISEEKQPLYALRIIKKVLEKIPDAKLLVVGKADSEQMQKAFDEEIDNLGIGNSVEQFGFQKNVKRFYQQTDVFLCTSRYEGFLLTLLESKANGVPAVVFDLPNLDMVRERKGMIVVPQGDIDAATEAIVTLLTDQEYASAMGNEALQSAIALSEFDQEAFWKGVFISAGKPAVVSQESLSIAVRLQAESMLEGYLQTQEAISWEKNHSNSIASELIWYKNQHENLIKELDWYKEQYSGLTTALEWYKKQYSLLTEDLNWYKEQYTSLTAALDWHKKQCASLTADLDWHKEQYASLTADLDWHKAHFADLQKESKWLKGQYNLLTREAECLGEQSESNIAKINMQQTEIQELEKRVETHDQTFYIRVLRFLKKIYQMMLTFLRNSK